MSLKVNQRSTFCWLSFSFFLLNTEVMVTLWSFRTHWSPQTYCLLFNPTVNSYALFLCVFPCCDGSDALKRVRIRKARRKSYLHLGKTEQSKVQFVYTFIRIWFLTKTILEGTIVQCLMLCIFPVELRITTAFTQFQKQIHSKYHRDSLRHWTDCEAALLLSPHQSGCPEQSLTHCYYFC